MPYTLSINNQALLSADTLHNLLYKRGWQIISDASTSKAIRTLHRYDADGLFAANNNFRYAFTGSLVDTNDDHGRRVRGRIVVSYEAEGFAIESTH